jgi:hypothetical protein
MLLTFISLQRCRLNPVCYAGFGPRYSTPSSDADDFTPHQLWSATSTPVCSIDTFRPDAYDFTPRQLRFVVFYSCHPDASDINLLACNDQTLGGSTTTSPLMIRETTSV